MIFDFSIELPGDDVRLMTDSKLLKATAGRAIATAVKKRMRSGRGKDGQPMPAPKDGGTPGVRTGELVRSIRYVSRNETVHADGRRSEQRKRPHAGERNMGLMAIQVYTRWGSLPMGVDDEIRAAAQAALDKAIARHVKQGKTRLVGELRRIMKRGR